MKTFKLLSFVFFSWILYLPILAIAETMEPGEGSQINIKTSVNDITETVLERFLEASQLIWIQVKQLIDPADIGVYAALQMHLANPFLMGGVGLAVAGIPILVYRSIQTRRRRQQELQELKDAMEDEDYDYEEKFRKIHGSEEIGEGKEEETSKKDEEIEEVQAEDSSPPSEEVTHVTIPFWTVKEKEIEEVQAEDRSPPAEEVIQVTIPFWTVKEETAASSHSFEIEEPDAEGSQDDTVERSSLSQGENLAEVRAEEFDSSTPAESGEEGIDKELSSLQEEMERTIQAISDQLVEDDGSPGISTESKPEPPSFEQTFQELTEVSEALSSSPLSPSGDEVTKPPSVDEILKWAEGISIDSSESETSTPESLDLPDDISQETKQVETPTNEIDDEFVQMAKSLSQELAGDPDENNSIEGTPEVASNKLSKSLLENELSAEPKIEPIAKEFNDLQLQTPPSTGYQKPIGRSTVPPERTRDYVNRLEQFQKRLENRIKSLEDDLPVLSPFERWLKFRETPIARKPILQDKIDKSTSWEYEDGKRTIKKAYSLDVLESFLLLDNQKD